MITARAQRFCGREFNQEEITLIEEVVQSCGGLSRTELAHTVCELLDWKRPGGKLKGRECMELLERLEGRGVFSLPERRTPGATGPRRSISPAGPTEAESHLAGSVEDFTPLDVELCGSRGQRALFGELLSRHHYLGYAMPYGARLQYLIYVTRPCREVVGCVQFSSPAWRMKVRDQWIGWDDTTRAERLQHIVNNSRLLIIPRIRNLASMALSAVIRRLRSDWPEHYGVDPWLAETLVDRSRFHGGCYIASSWIELGSTSGRGRMDRTHQRHGAQVKAVMVYPLVKNAAGRLRERG